MPRLKPTEIRRHVTDLQKELNVCRAASMPVFRLTSRMDVELFRIERRRG